MRKLRGSLAGLAILTTLSLTLTGCTGGDGGGTKGPASSPTPADPRQVLASSIKGLADGNFSYTVTGHEQKAEGVADKKSNSARASMTIGAKDFTQDTQLIYVAPDIYAKIVLKTPELPAGQPGSGKWQHIDPTRVRDNPTVQFSADNNDLIGGRGIIAAVLTAGRDADGGYTGTTDLTALKNSALIDADMIAEMGLSARSVPFKATLDDQGRLGTLTLKMPAIADTPAADLTVTYTGYGAAPATSKPPAAETEEATEETYEMLQ
ncbi:MAG TPA: hypothetical protein VF755_15735 [Catenuloplanes sp.]